MPPIVLSPLEPLESIVSELRPSRHDVVPRVASRRIPRPPAGPDLCWPAGGVHKDAAVGRVVLRGDILGDEVPALGLLHGPHSDMILDDVRSVVCLMYGPVE